MQTLHVSLISSDRLHKLYKIWSILNTFQFLNKGRAALGLSETLRKAEDGEGMEKSGCPIILNAPTVIKTIGKVK